MFPPAPAALAGRERRPRAARRVALWSLTGLLAGLLTGCGPDASDAPSGSAASAAGGDAAAADRVPPSGFEATPASQIAPTAEAAEPVATPTWARDIAPLLHSTCVTCHRPGGGGPFDLLTYEDARRRAKQLRIVTEDGYMPPWPPAPGPFRFLGERRLSAAERQTIANWAANGAPAGDLERAPEPPTFSSTWHLGPPDLVVTMPQAYVVPADGGDVFRNFVLPVGVDAPAFVRAAEIRPSNRRVVHHATMVVDRTGAARRQDAQDDEIGYASMDPFVESDAPSGFFLNYKPGTVPVPGPDGMAWRVGPSTDLVLNMHLQPTGRPEEISVEVGLYFTDQVPTLHPYILRLNADDQIDIPPGATDFALTDALVLPVDVDVYGIYAHMHYLGKSAAGTATLPDGQVLDLLSIPVWDFDWQAVYFYEEPVSLPAGTRLDMRLAFDNSAGNPLNPHDPPIQIRAGNRSEDEMAHLALQVVPQRREQVYELQEALMRTRLERTPKSAFAHARLADALRSKGETEGAIRHYRAALKLRPDDLLARNNLAGLLLSLGLNEPAERQLRATLEIEPGYLNGLNNLAFLLLSTGRHAEAIPLLEQALEIRPADADALTRLGVALMATNAPGAAQQRFEAALALDATHLEARRSYGRLLASAGRLEAAVAQFEAALLLAPDDARLQQHLARARRQLASQGD